jgi:excinuclease ABC subunit B
MEFQLVSDFQPTGDQPQAIKEIVNQFQNRDPFVTLQGVTGSGKTFTMANAVKELQRPTLVLAHNKTLAAQLYSEFKQFFPNNAVEYFVSYYDYYQPEAYIPTTGTYIEKDLSINEEIEKLRLSTTSSLLSGRRDVLVVASVSCLYGIGNPAEFEKNVIELERDQVISRTQLMHRLVQSLYSRTTAEFSRGNFRVLGDIIDVFPGYADIAFKIHFFGDEIELIEAFDPINNQKIEQYDKVNIYPCQYFCHLT